MTVKIYLRLFIYDEHVQSNPEPVRQAPTGSLDSPLNAFTIMHIF